MTFRLRLPLRLQLILSTGAFAQNPNDFLNLFGAMMQQGMRQSAQTEWRKLSQTELSCLGRELKSQETSIDALINSGVMPSDPRISQLRSNCRAQVGQQYIPPVSGQSSPYIVDGLALYGQVRLERQAYQEYQC